ncbi:hypothetical protein H4R18_002177 [Coemansia javaensis]|uniref:Uncharacterized protein n=1 Tax=Coemansia javaensis TaxID=2761396 RepID=A0A9W8HFW1_9FUNG|nr:hypothetical protein H4R18_002177 [Coemansia javaensis]
MGSEPTPTHLRKFKAGGMTDGKLVRLDRGTATSTIEALRKSGYLLRRRILKNGLVIFAAVPNTPNGWKGVRGLDLYRNYPESDSAGKK